MKTAIIEGFHIFLNSPIAIVLLAYSCGLITALEANEVISWVVTLIMIGIGWICPSYQWKNKND